MDQVQEELGQNQQGNQGYRTPRVFHARRLCRLARHSQIAHRARLIMGRRNRKGDRHNARSGETVYGTHDQISGYAALVKCQCSQVSNTCSSD
jgi:hypothetical protein